MMQSTPSAIESRALFPTKLKPLFQSHRYKVVRGGRGSAKSWSAARALLQIGANKRLSVLCAREFQSSIRDSVHRLLKNQIAAMKLGPVFDVERDVIYGPNGTMFVFVGLSDKTAENLKSYEDFDVCWVEEAQVLTDNSLNTLTPTIRKPGSEIWFTYNPSLATDPVHVFADSLRPDEGVVIEMNWRDNPFFHGTLNEERLRAKRTMSKIDYENIWEGRLRPAIEGAIYAEEMAAMEAERRIGTFPPDPYHLVYPVFDLGYNDKMAIAFVQRNVSQLRLIDYLEDSHKTLAWYSEQMRRKPYSYGSIVLPHDGGHGDYKTGKTAQEILEGLNWRVSVLPRVDLDDGIRDTRMALAQMFIDREKCARLIECLRRYRRSVPRRTGEPGGPLHDEFSHGADAVRYVAQATPLLDDEVGMALPDLVYPKTSLV